MTRRHQQLRADELTTLSEFLDRQRAGMVQRFTGLTADQLARTLPPSTLTLAGLIKHLAMVEDWWFQTNLLGRALGEPWASAPWSEDADWEFHSAPADPPAQLLAWYTEACDRSRATVAEVGDLDACSVVVRQPEGDYCSLRWILVHMIEETARHLGHADLLRESIDGDTSRTD
jgi:hypothetical protein